MSTFEAALPVLYLHEVDPRPKALPGWCDIPGDRGGETNWGWSTLTIKRLGLTEKDLGIPGPMFTAGYLKPMSWASAAALYKRYFWDTFPYAQIKDQVSATKVFDFAVNAGPGHAAFVAQRATGVTEDGVLGPISIAAINSLGAQFPRLMGASMAVYYEDLIARNPSQAKFRSIWLGRARWGT